MRNLAEIRVSVTFSIYEIKISLGRYTIIFQPCRFTFPGPHMRAPYANIPRDNITPFSNTHSEKHDLFSSRGTCYYESYLACVLCWDGSCNSAPSECGVLSYVLFSYRGTCYYESYLACVLCWDIITCLALAASCSNGRQFRDI